MECGRPWLGDESPPGNDACDEELLLSIIRGGELSDFVSVGWVATGRANAEREARRASQARELYAALRFAGIRSFLGAGGKGVQPLYVDSRRAVHAISICRTHEDPGGYLLGVSDEPGTSVLEELSRVPPASYEPPRYLPPAWTARLVRSRENPRREMGAGG